MELSTAAQRNEVFDAVDPYALLLAVPGVVAVVDAGGTIVWVNDQVTELSGHRPEDLIGTGMLDHLDMEANPLALESIGYALENEGIRLPTILGFRAVGDRTLMVEVVANNQFSNPAIGGLVVHIRPCDERDLIDQILTAMAGGAEMASVFERAHRVGAAATLRSSMSVILMGDAGRAAIGFNSADHGSDRVARLIDAADLWHGVPRVNESVILPNHDAMPPDVRRVAVEEGFSSIWAYPVGLLGTDSVGAVLLFCRREAGPPEPSAVMLATQLSRFTQLVLDRHDRSEQLLHAAHHDGLTGLINRNRFYDAVEEALQESDHPVGLAYLDLDGFKVVNDRFGHRIGDLVLIEVAARLVSIVGARGTIGRLGGDEFGICVPGMDLDALEQLTAEVLARLLDPIVIDGRDHVVGATLGLSAATRSSVGSADELVDEADGALIGAKVVEKGSARIAAAATARSWPAPDLPDL